MPWPASACIALLCREIGWLTFLAVPFLNQSYARGSEKSLWLDPCDVLLQGVSSRAGWRLKTWRGATQGLAEGAAIAAQKLILLQSPCPTCVSPPLSIHLCLCSTSPTHNFALLHALQLMRADLFDEDVRAGLGALMARAVSDILQASVACPPSLHTAS